MDLNENDKLILNNFFSNFKINTFVDEVTLKKYVYLSHDWKNLVNYLVNNNYLLNTSSKNIKKYKIINNKKFNLENKEKILYLNILYNKFLFDKFDEKMILKKNLYENEFSKFFNSLVDDGFLNIKPVNDKNIYHINKEKYLEIYPRSDNKSSPYDLFIKPSNFKKNPKRIANPNSKFRLGCMISIGISFILIVVAISSFAFIFTEQSMYYITIIGFVFLLPWSIFNYIYSRKALDGEIKNEKIFKNYISIVYLFIPSYFIFKGNYNKNQ